MIRGDGTDPKTLERANLSDADVVAALTDSTEINLTVCKAAKEQTTNARTIFRIARDGEQDYGYRRFVDHTVYPAAGVDVAVDQITRN